MLNKLRIVSRRNPQAESALMFYNREKNMDTWFVLVSFMGYQILLMLIFCLDRRETHARKSKTLVGRWRT
jgi:hypothetical protein